MAASLRTDPARRVAALCPAVALAHGWSAVRERQEVTTIERSALGDGRAGDAGVPVGRRAGRRDSYEAVGLLLGVLGVLIAVVVTVGAGPRF